MAEDVPEPGAAVDGEDASSQAGSEATVQTGSAGEVAADAADGAAAPDGVDEAQPTGESPAGTEVASAGDAAHPPVRRSRRTLVLSAALVLIVGVIVVDVVVIVKGAKKGAEPVAIVHTAPSSAPSRPSAAPSASAAAFAKPVDAGLFLDYDDGQQQHATEPEHHVHYRTVEQAANRTCNTRSVDGLSRQIIRQSRCFDRNAFVRVPPQPNLKAKSNVYLYLERPARQHLLRVLAANRNKTMVVNSALRTVAQQYVLQQWYRNHRCGITLAALPGQSNHETGLALDVAEAYKWRPAMAKQHFHWLGKVDGMHFDYKGPGAATGIHADVKAFQQLWNENHPKDRIPDNGVYTPRTEERLKQSPAAGFKHGPHCG